MLRIGVVALLLAGVALAELDLTDWNNFKSVHGKSYSSAEEESRRLGVFRRNVAFIEKFNREEAPRRGYTLGVNQFADLNSREFRQMRLGVKYNMSDLAKDYEIDSSLDSVKVSDLPAQVDWRTSGAVTPVKDQGQCGSCWAFSTTGSIEGQHFLKNGQLVSLSEQQMVDCSWLNHGCNGGQMMLAFLYVILNGGLEPETTYPYTAVGGSCKHDRNAAVAKISGFKMAGLYSETALQKASATVGPISVAMDASRQDFQFYKSGIYNPASCGTILLDHGVLVVGYGSDGQGQDYWLVKNSWNTTWGDQGYFKVARNQGNKCGLATMPSYPTV